MTDTLLEARGVTKEYAIGARTIPVLRGVDFALARGEKVALLGSSGAGKSTLLHVLGLLDAPSSGSIVFEGQRVDTLGIDARARLRHRRIGFVFQFYHLLPEFTALENVMMPALCKGASRKAAEVRAEELLHTVGLAERMTHKPGQLSGGEQQRVAIARALYNKPGVVLSDEPTGNLDENTGGSIIDLLWKLNEEHGVTLVVVTHDDSLAARAHRWVHMHGGTAAVKKG